MLSAILAKAADLSVLKSTSLSYTLVRERIAIHNVNDVRQNDCNGRQWLPVRMNTISAAF